MTFELLSYDAEVRLRLTCFVAQFSNSSVVRGFIFDGFGA